MTHRSARRARHVLSVVLLAAGWGAALPTGASAARVVAAPAAPDIVSEVPFPVTITGIADTPSTLSVGLAEIGEGCYSPVIAEEILDDLPVMGPFSLEQPALVEAPGQHLLCAFLETEGHTTVAASVAPFAARAPRSQLMLSAPDVVALGHTMRVRVGGTAEAPRHVWAKLAPPGLRCDAAFESLITPRLGFQESATAFDLVGTFRPDRFGTWRLCAKTNRYYATVDPTDTFTERLIRVTVPCTAASRELSRARDRWRAMSRRLRLRGLPPSPHLRIRGMAVRRARAWVAEACSPGA